MMQVSPIVKNLIIINAIVFVAITYMFELANVFFGILPSINLFQTITDRDTYVHACQFTTSFFQYVYALYVWQCDGVLLGR